MMFIALSRLTAAWPDHEVERRSTRTHVCLWTVWTLSAHRSCNDHVRCVSNAREASQQRQHTLSHFGQSCDIRRPADGL